jgi:hypothetical protein
MKNNVVFSFLVMLSLLGAFTTVSGQEAIKSFSIPTKPKVTATQPTITVPDGMIQAGVGDFVIISAKSDAPAIVWVVPDLSVLSRIPVSELADKSKLIVACKRPGIHSVFAIAVKDGETSEQAVVRISVKGAEPGPGPGPGPLPDLPDGQYKLAKFAYDAANSYVEDPDTRVKGSAALSSSFDAIAARIAAGTITVPDTALVELEASNAAALAKVKIDRATWDAWGTALQKEWLPLYKNGKMKSMDDFKNAFKEVATGLKAVR